MSTQAFITLYNLDHFDPSTKMPTVTLMRHCDGYMGAAMAEFFYQAFSNPLKAKGSYFERFICADPSQVVFYSMDTLMQDDCMGHYHYHIDLKTMMLNVMHEDEIYNVPRQNVFSGGVDKFINQFSHNPFNGELGFSRAITSVSDYSKRLTEVFTLDSMFEEINKFFKIIDDVSNNPLNPNFKNYMKRIDRRLVFLSEFNLSEEQRNFYSIAVNLNNKYEMVYLATLEAQNQPHKDV